MLMHGMEQTISLLVGFSPGLSASQQYFFLTINQHQLDVSVYKPISEQKSASAGLISLETNQRKGLITAHT